MKNSKWLPVVRSLASGEDIILPTTNETQNLLNSLKKHGYYGRCRKLGPQGWIVWASKEPGPGAKRRKNLTPNPKTP